MSDSCRWMIATRWLLEVSESESEALKGGRSSSGGSIKGSIAGSHVT